MRASVRPSLCTPKALADLTISQKLIQLILIANTLANTSQELFAKMTHFLKPSLKTASRFGGKLRPRKYANLARAFTLSKSSNGRFWKSKCTAAASSGGLVAHLLSQNRSMSDFGIVNAPLRPHLAALSPFFKGPPL